MAKRKRRMATAPAMASLPRSASNPDSLSSALKNIPLLCSVCPETPNFSDLSHLLTHIASKGHLHHETQTKLKAHQDPTSSLALQNYEQWYKDNKIEGLLVDRMKAKQVKEAARNKRTRSSPPATTSKNNRKQIRRSTSQRIAVKTEDVLASDVSGLAGFFASDNEIDAPEEAATPGDVVSMKGQVWPGMGKMDLATDEMKRTRNQRKPKSVVEKMRRNSEEIEPTQVVMTSQLDIERVKGVYDDDSPVSDQEETSPPRKPAKRRCKKTQPLAEISSNVPRGTGGRTRSSVTEKQAKIEPELDTQNVDMLSATSGLQSRNPIFRDENKIEASSNSSYQSSTQRESRFDLRDRGRLQGFGQNCHPILSPHTSSRDTHTPIGSQRDPSSQGRLLMQPYLNSGSQFPLGSFGHHETPFTLGDSQLYPNSRFPFIPDLQYDISGQEHSRLPADHHHIIPKSEEFPQNDPNDSLGSSGPNLYLNLGTSNANQLFYNDRLFLNAYNQPTTNPPFSNIGSAATGMGKNSGYSLSTDELLQTSSNSPVKTESEAHALLGAGLSEADEAMFDPKNVWHLHGADATMEIPGGLRSEDLSL